MSEKETQESVEEQNQEQVTEDAQEVKASEESPEKVETASGNEAEEVSEVEAASREEVEEEASQAEETAPEEPVVKKGLMQRRPDYSQSSVPNVHKGYSTNPPIVMLLIVSVFILLSIIFATSAVIN